MRSEGYGTYGSCPVCVSVSVCLSVRSFLPPRVRRSQYIGTNWFTATQKNLIIVVFASFRSYGVICLPRMSPTTLTPKDAYQRDQRKVGNTLIFAILTKNASFRSYGIFAYLLRAHIRNIKRRIYVSARGHELSGRVRAKAYTCIIIESVDSISRDEPDSPLTQYITNAGISRDRYTITHFKHHHRVPRLISNRITSLYSASLRTHRAK